MGLDMEVLFAREYLELWINGTIKRLNAPNVKPKDQSEEFLQVFGIVENVTQNLLVGLTLFLHLVERNHSELPNVSREN